MKIDSTTELSKLLDFIQYQNPRYFEPAIVELRRRDDELRRLIPMANAAMVYEHVSTTSGVGNPVEARARLLSAARIYARTQPAPAAPSEGGDA
jgi:hypothetical protein